MVNQNSIYQVNKNILQNLEAKEAEDLLRKLLYAEARRVGIPISSIHIPIETNAPDGGVDAQVDSHVQIPRQDLMKSEYTCYQIKSGSSFKPANPSAIEKELFGQGNEPKKDGVADKTLILLVKVQP